MGEKIRINRFIVSYKQQNDLAEDKEWFQLYCHCKMTCCSKM
jgi:hypothetical protein